MIYWLSMFEVTVNNFKEILECEEPVLLFFHSAWCTGCGPEMEVLVRMEKEYAGVLFAMVDADKEVEINTLLRVYHLPALFLFHHGKVLDYRSGFQSDSAVREMLEKTDSFGGIS